MGDSGYLRMFAVTQAVGAGVVAEADAEVSLPDVLTVALEANERMAQELRAAQRLKEENARLRERDAQRETELERVSAELAVLQWLVFGRSSAQAAAGRRTRAGSAAVRPEGSADPGCGRGGGITRICPGCWTGT
jgi:hypothetical protein